MFKNKSSPVLRPCYFFFRRTVCDSGQKRAHRKRHVRILRSGYRCVTGVVYVASSSTLLVHRYDRVRFTTYTTSAHVVYAKQIPSANVNDMQITACYRRQSYTQVYGARESFFVWRRVEKRIIIIVFLIFDGFGSCPPGIPAYVRALEMNNGRYSLGV